MVKLVSTYSTFEAKMRQDGRVRVVSAEVTARIDHRIAESISESQKRSVVKQNNSAHLMKMRELKNFKK